MTIVINNYERVKKKAKNNNNNNNNQLATYRFFISCADECCNVIFALKVVFLIYLLIFYN